MVLFFNETQMKKKLFICDILWLNWYKIYIFLCFVILSSVNSFAQRDTVKWKLQLALGVNYPAIDGFSEGFSAKSVNFPTYNIGIQYMFARELGAKLDIGFSRFENDNNVPDFKTNYTRLNAQFVYDPTPSLNFMPRKMRVVFHAGPGISFVQPLGDEGINKETFLNGIFGGEIHYKLSKTFAVYVDGSYVLGFSSINLNELSPRLGAFNGNIIHATIGISISLSGCYYCN
jgi:hypothetical protein